MRANSTNPDNLGADLSISRILVFNCYARVCMAVCLPATPTFLPKRFFYIILKLCTFHNFQFLLLQLFIFIFFFVEFNATCNYAHSHLCELPPAN